MISIYQNIFELKNIKLPETLADYVKIKLENKDCVVLFQIGEFYEAYLEDAKILSEACSIYLTTKKIKSGSLIMAGIPSKSLEEYVVKLVDFDYKVLVCNQKEENNKIKREIKRIYSKGMIFEDNLLNSSKNNYIVSIFKDKNLVGLAKADISTGEFSTCEGSLNEILNELKIIEPSELLIPVKTRETKAFQVIDEPKPDIDADFSNFNVTLVKKSSFSSSLIKSENLGYKCVNAILEYSKLTNKEFAPKIGKIKRYNLNDYLTIDETASLNLELFKTTDNKYKGSFLWAIDNTLTPMGKRLLINWIKKPLRNIKRIETRQNALEEYKNSNNISNIQNALKNCYDIKRLWGKLTGKTLSIKDFISLKNTIKQCFILGEYTKNFNNGLIKFDLEVLQNLKSLLEILDNSLQDEEDGEIFKEGANTHLDLIKKDIEKYYLEIKKYEEKEKEKTGIKSLKIIENKILGYFIEVGSKNILNVPDYFKIRQNMLNSSRYTTDELVILNEKINSLMYRKMNAEKEILNGLKEFILGFADDIYELGNKLASLDVINSFYITSEGKDFVKPEFNDLKTLKFTALKHPLSPMIFENYIPNDFKVEDLRRFKLLTGPNMAGKSTYMKSIALNIILAQMGSYTCASKFESILFDRIFVHSKSEDYINKGKSTFMSEMCDVKEIVENATDESFIIFDELAKGTSTSDGLKLAFGISKYVIDNINAITIFATHFHKLKALKERYPDKVQNLMIGENFNLEEKIFDRHVKEGFLNESYGINVARAVNLPYEIIKQACDFEV